METHSIKLSMHCCANTKFVDLLLLTDGDFCALCASTCADPFILHGLPLAG
ncbi:unnamed protein product [Staurois parvus]|uniref:Uncharacterized protein n=1 Tax=Staurois parvus TaxID=386267 RepID=A0ABN9CKK7_9NEOB|nr:unnamed protein product [Staurois parvus]